MESTGTTFFSTRKKDVLTVPLKVGVAYIISCGRWAENLLSWVMVKPPHKGSRHVHRPDGMYNPFSVFGVSSQLDVPENLHWKASRGHPNQMLRQFGGINQQAVLWLVFEEGFRESGDVI